MEANTFTIRTEYLKMTEWGLSPAKEYRQWIEIYCKTNG